MFTPEFIAQVALYGVTVIGIVEVVKRAIKIKSWLAVIASVLISIFVCLPSLKSVSTIEWIILVICVVLEANGVFKALHSTG